MRPADLLSAPHAMPNRTPDTITEDLPGAVLGLLRQAGALVGALDDRLYAASSAELGASIGQHVRHCLDHVEQFVAGLRDGVVDYDARERDAGVERDRAVALARLAALGPRVDAALRSVPLDRPIDVRAACAVAGDVGPQSSTCGRELQFVVSHTVHHLAMIAAICRLHGVAVAPELGVAPSTLRYRARS